MKALTGQMSTHSLQSPHLTPMEESAFSGASVSMVANLTLGPYLGVIRRQLFPIQPRPDRFAASLWEIAPMCFLLSMVWEAGMGYA